MAIVKFSPHLFYDQVRIDLKRNLEELREVNPKSFRAFDGVPSKLPKVCSARLEDGWN